MPSRNRSKKRRVVLTDVENNQNNATSSVKEQDESKRKDKSQNNSKISSSNGNMNDLQENHSVKEQMEQNEQKDLESDSNRLKKNNGIADTVNTTTSTMSLENQTESHHIPTMESSVFLNPAITPLLKVLQNDSLEKNIIVSVSNAILQLLESDPRLLSEISEHVAFSSADSYRETIELLHTLLHRPSEQNGNSNTTDKHPTQENVEGSYSELDLKNSLIEEQKLIIQELEKKVNQWEADFDEESKRIESKYRFDKDELKKLLDLERSEAEQSRMMAAKLSDELFEFKQKFDEDKMIELESNIQRLNMENDKLRETINTTQKENAQTIQRINTLLEEKTEQLNRLQSEKDTLKRQYLHHALLSIKMQSQDSKFNTISVPELVDEAIDDNVENLVGWLSERGFEI